MKEKIDVKQEHYTPYRSHSRHRRHRHKWNGKHYSQERQSYNKSELAFMLKCTAFVVILMILLIPLLANFIESA